jgi:hypothetical protein
MELLEEGATLEALNAELRSGLLAGQASREIAVGGGWSPDVPSVSANRTLGIFADMCDALSFIHEAGIVHCDLKPANIFVRNDGTPVLMDFGLLSRASGAIGRESLEIGGIRGTLPYLAPELIQGKIPDARADLYALGCMLYESLSGAPPFVAARPRVLLEAHLHAEPVPLSQRVSALPAGLEELAAALLAKQPEGRPASADAVHERLCALLPSRVRARARPRVPLLLRPRLVGRDEVVARIARARDEASAGTGRLVLIGGESGIGKTFLGSEVARDAARAGFEVIVGECAPFSAAPASGAMVPTAPLDPFRSLLRRAADRSRKRGEGPLDRVSSPIHLQLLARYEPALQHLVDPADEEPAVLPPAAERERVVEAMKSLLAAFVEQKPLLILIDDLQWADDLSLTVLESLTSEYLADMAILVVALYRSEEAPEAVNRLRKAPQVQTIDLERLGREALAVMVGDLLSRQPPRQLVDALASHSEGNPFFVAEYLRAAASERLLIRSPQGWMLGELPTISDGLDELALPRSLHDLLARRFQGLSDQALGVVEIAAVAGREFQLSTLAAIDETREDDLGALVRELVDRQLVNRAQGQRLRFAHDKIREFAYARIDARRRRALHLSVARSVEASCASALELAPRYAELAYHFRNGDEPARAVEYFARAAEHALNHSANSDAVRLFRQAIDLAGVAGIGVPARQRAHWLRRTGDALHSIGDLSGSKQSLIDALDLLGHPVPTSDVRLTVGILRSLATQVGHRVLPRRWIEARPAEIDDVVETARAFDRLMQVCFFRGEFGPLFFSNLATLEHAERAPPSPTLAIAYTNAGATAGIVPLRRATAFYFRLAEETLRAAYDPEVEVYYRVVKSNYSCGVGAWEDAAADADRVLELTEAIGYQRRWSEAAAVRCLMAMGRDFDECLAWCDRMFDAGVRSEDPQIMCWGHLSRAEVAVWRGDRKRAEAHLTLAEPLLSRLGLPEQMRATALRGQFLLARGASREALSVGDEAARLADKAKVIHSHCISTYGRIAEIAVTALADPALRSRDVRRKARSACQRLQKAANVFPIAVPLYCLHEGSRRRCLGDEAAAVRLWTRGTREAARLRLPFDEAHLLLKLAAATRASRPYAAALDERRATLALERLGVREAHP